MSFFFVCFLFFNTTIWISTITTRPSCQKLNCNHHLFCWWEWWSFSVSNQTFFVCFVTLPTCHICHQFLFLNLIIYNLKLCMEWLKSQIELASTVITSQWTLQWTKEWRNVKKRVTDEGKEADSVRRLRRRQDGEMDFNESVVD